MRLILWPFAFAYGFVRGASTAFVAEFKRSYRAQRR